ncbi:nitrile hydratase subunit beta [Roseobacter sp.]|uniref:nitrile hydratase subunit beta n=1 Tax=Roseobacter sp. TaxID=1907202 RepID=UPI0025D68384|nr:nitrile hydratase subunit beta [Roseobacter sp.]
MSRAHDMGGRFGDGAVTPEPETPVFHTDWHARALALTLACGALGKWNIDVSRHARESLSPTDYARFSYYEKWMAGLADLLADTGLVSREELSGQAPVQSGTNDRMLTADRVASVLATGGPADRPSDIAQQFAPGDAVITRRLNGNRLVNGGHTRLPGYAAGARGRILRFHGTHILPDSSAHHLGDAAEPLYAVAFPAAELWTHPEHPGDEVVLDLWQSYLEPAA